MVFGVAFQEVDQINLVGAQEFKLLGEPVNRLLVFKMAK